MREFLTAVHQHLAEGRDLCLGTIIGRHGSSPRSMGSQFFVERDSFFGTIGGGSFEAEVIEQARLALGQSRAELMHYRLMGKDAADSEMICGGDLDVYLEPLSGRDELALSLYQAAAELAADGGRGLLATLLAPGPVDGVAGRKALVSQGAEPLGSLGTDQDILRALAKDLPSYDGASAPHLWAGSGNQLQPAGVLVEPIISRPVVYIFGGGHVSQKLAPLVSMAGFGLVVADDRPEWANRERFPQAQEIWNEPMDQVLADRRLGRDSYVVIVTRGHLYDKDVLGQTLGQDAAYVGMIGSRRKRNLIYQALSEEGVGQDRLASVYSPIGLDIGAETPEEIAISIVAELVAVRAGKDTHR